MVGLESIRCSNVVVFGKARKLVGGEGSKRPREILPSPNPVENRRTAQVIRCWTGRCRAPTRRVCSWSPARLVQARPTLPRTCACSAQQRRCPFAAAAAGASPELGVRLEGALAFCGAHEVVPGDLPDPRFRVLAASNAAAAELRRKDAEVAARGAGESPRAPRKPATRRRAGSATVAPLRYDARDVIADGAFVARRLESLRLSGSLVPGSELTKPPVIDAFANVLEETKKKEAPRPRRRAEPRREPRREPRSAGGSRRPGGRGGGGGLFRPARAVPGGPRAHSRRARPGCSPIVRRGSSSSPRRWRCGIS